MSAADSAIGSLVQFFEKFIVDFTWRRFVFVTVCLSLAAGSLVFYEQYTHSFKITRLNREADLLERVIALDEKYDVVSDQELNSAMTGLRQHTRDLINPERTGAVVSRGTWKFLHAALPWVLLGFLFFFPGIEGGRSAIGGMAVVAIPTILIIASIPDVGPTWVNNWVIPWVIFLFLIGLMLMRQRTSKKDSA